METLKLLWRRHLADVLCLAGVALVVVALWQIHEALAIGVLGGLLSAMGVGLHRQRVPVEPEVKQDDR